MNMKQRLAFSALLVAPAVVTISMPNASAYTPATSPVYETIYVDLAQLTGTIEKYSWAVVDGENVTPLVGFAGNSFAVKPEHSGKSIQVTAHRSDGAIEKSTTAIDPLIPAFKEASTFTAQNGAPLTEAYEGLTLQAKPSIVVMQNSDPQVQIPSTDVVYTYAWYKVAGDTRERIPNAVGSYTIPETFRHNVTGPVSIEVDISATIKGLPHQAAIVDRVKMSIQNDPVEELIEAIDALLHTSPETFYTYNMDGRTFQQFKEHVTTLQLQVSSLPGTLMTKITNIDILQAALANVTSAESFLNAKTIAMTTNQLNDMERAKKVASNLNQLQLSLVKSDYDELYGVEGPNAQLPETNIQNLNDLLLQLYSITNLEELNEQIAEAEHELTLLSKQVHGLIQLHHLTKAKQNSNALRSFTNKFVLIGETANETPTAKDIKAAHSAYAVYAKLTHEQAILVPEEQLAFIQMVLSNEQNAALSLLEDIHNLHTTLSEETQLETTAEFVAVQQEVDLLMGAYKQLSSKARKFVTNYDQLKEIRASLKDTARAEALIRQLVAIDPDTNLKSARSKLQAAQKATLKLSKIEHALLINKETLIDYSDGVSAAMAAAADPYSELAQSFATNIEQWDIFDDYMTYGDVSDFPSFSVFEAEVSEFNKQFRALAAKERNSMPAKIFLKTATSDIKAVKNVMKKITAAISEPKTTKQYSRILTAERAYAKLSAAQQSLLTMPYQNGQMETPYQQLQNKKAEVLDVATLNETLSTFKQEGYDRDIPELQIIVNGYNNLSSAVKHLIPENGMIKTITKDIKVIQNFHSKFGSIILNIDTDQATADQKKALIAAYEKLTFTQHSLLAHVETLEDVASIVETLREENTLASVASLYRQIDSIVENGRYTEQATLDNIQLLIEAFKSLKPEERRVITNYDMLTTAEKHIQTVNALRASKPEDLTTFEGKAWLNKTTNLKPLEASLLTE